jgi:hypothetical protein
MQPVNYDQLGCLFLDQAVLLFEQLFLRMMGL